MISLLYSLFLKIKEVFLTIILALGTLLFVYFRGKKDGASDVKSKIEEDNKIAKKERENIDDSIKTLDNNSLDKRASRWLLKSKG